MYLSVIIPAYNEAQRIGKTLDAVKAYLNQQSYDWEVIVVNNNSSDDTADVIRRYMLHDSRYTVIDEPKQGKGYAVQTGMLAAGGDFRLFTDADNSTGIEHVERMLTYARSGYDVVIGSLAVKGAHVIRGEPFYRVLFGKMGNKFIQLVAVWGISDTQRGFKLFTARAAQAIFPMLTIFGWGFDVEVLALARKFRFTIKEVGVNWNNDPNSKVNMWAYPQVLLQTLKIRWNLMTNKYKT